MAPGVEKLLLRAWGYCSAVAVKMEDAAAAEINYQVKIAAWLGKKCAGLPAYLVKLVVSSGLIKWEKRLAARGNSASKQSGRACPTPTLYLLLAAAMIHRL